jgi:putative CocE/NonD family hydrolase
MKAVLRILAPSLLACAALAQDSVFEKREAMIPTRDGVKLHTVLFTPRDAAGPLPILLERTPYGALDEEKELLARYPHLVADGYIFAFQDIRGRFKSEGEFVMQRPPRDAKDPKGIDEGTDAYDTIEWMVHNVGRNNGRVGILGISYGGWLTTMALLEPHPALKAASEQASPADMFLGDDFHHNGAFRLSYGFEYAAMMETAKEANTHFEFDHADTYQWYLELGALSNVNEKYLHGTLPTWNDFVNHPNYDEFWQKQAFPRYIHSPKVPNLNVGGWWDQEDFYGPLKIYELFEKDDPHHLNYLVAGPWNHGGWARTDGTRLGEIPLDSNTSKFFKTQIEAPWFAYWLKDKGTRDFPEAMVFQTGSNRWQKYDSWPPVLRRAHGRRLGYLSLRPGAPGTLPPPPHQPDLPRRRLARVAGGGSALRREPARRSHVADRAAEAGREHCRRYRGRAIRFDHRIGQRLGGEADRRLP